VQGFRIGVHGDIQHQYPALLQIGDPGEQRYISFDPGNQGGVGDGVVQAQLMQAADSIGVAVEYIVLRCCGTVL
jgi:hypothetical protein